MESRAAACDLIVAEGMPSHEAFPAQKWMSKIRTDHLIDQMNGLDLERTGVPVQWEEAAPPKAKSGREQAVAAVTDSAALVMKALGQATVAVVYGAAHTPAVVDYLTQTYRYYHENSEWLTVVQAPA